MNRSKSPSSTTDQPARSGRLAQTSLALGAGLLAALALASQASAAILWEDYRGTYFNNSSGNPLAEEVNPGADPT
ncbi:hypothetical protein [Ottowia sp.]|jgi:hypothetical protein|uniref:hypothetical protein n=1 Tax=Ottowia sp. TaxID=1898956 RepID=UPI0025EAAFE5|nr:hypothetical protein [Ottowia sp.]MBK6614935.1 hypothetical protein [Ottowia sp.]